MKKYYVEVQNFNENYRNGIMICSNLDDAVSNYKKELHDLCNHNYFANKSLTVCVGELNFKDRNDYEKNLNYEMNELSCCDVPEFYQMGYEEKESLFNRLKNLEKRN